MSPQPAANATRLPSGSTPSTRCPRESRWPRPHPHCSERRSRSPDSGRPTNQTTTRARLHRSGALQMPLRGVGVLKAGRQERSARRSRLWPPRSPGGTTRGQRSGATSFERRCRSRSTRRPKQWLEGARAGVIRTRSGDPSKPERDPCLRAGRCGCAYSLSSGTRQGRRAHARRPAGPRRPARRERDEREHGGGDAAAAPAIYKRALARGEVAVNPTTGLLEMPAVRGGRDRIASPDECARSCSLRFPSATGRCGRRRCTPDCGAAS